MIARCSPGLAVVGPLVAAGFAANLVVPAVSPLLWAMALGVLLARFAQARPATSAGIALAATHLLRTGIALLGLRISLGELADVGAAGIAVAAGTVVATMLATVWLGRRIGVGRDLALLIATGSAICGASAIAAIRSVTGARDEEVGYAVATVTVFGTAAMLLLPPASRALGLGDADAGIWAGASIHEVAQATGAGAVISAAALKVATLVKLSRVVMLAAVVAVVGASRSRSAGAPPVRVPGFVLAFLALVAARSAIAMPEAVLDASAVASTALLAAGLTALGLGIRFEALQLAGLRPFALGVAASAIAATSALALLLVMR